MENWISKTHICLIGNGRLAKQLQAYLAESLKSVHVSFSHVYRAQNTPSEITRAIQNSSHIWLAISDQAIESFYNEFYDTLNADDSSADQNNKIWVHFSGAHNSKNIFSVHPLMTFTNNPFPQNDFNKIHLTISPPSQRTSGKILSLSELMPGLKNPWSFLPADKKAFYHALCVMGGNFPIILWSEILNQFQKLSIPDEALYRYLDQSLTNFKNEGAAALTGPIVRNDTKTINENLASLNAHPFKSIYESFIKAKGVSL